MYKSIELLDEPKLFKELLAGHKPVEIKQGIYYDCLCNLDLWIPGELTKAELTPSNIKTSIHSRPGGVDWQGVYNNINSIKYNYWGIEEKHLYTIGISKIITKQSKSTSIIHPRYKDNMFGTFHRDESQPLPEIGYHYHLYKVN